MPLTGIVRGACALYDLNKDCRNSTACTNATAACGGILGNIVSGNGSTGGISNVTAEQRACLCSNATRGAVSQCGNDKCAFASILSPALDEICIVAGCVTDVACKNATALCSGFLGSYINGTNDGSPTLSQLTCLCGADYRTTIEKCAAACPYAADVVSTLDGKCDVKSSTVKTTATATAMSTATGTRTAIVPTLPITSLRPSSGGKLAAMLFLICML